MMNIPFPPGRSARGFTLIELMIAVAIVGILVKLAYPVYTQSVRKSRRAEAKTALLDLAQREERYMSTANKYSNTASPDLGYNSGTTLTSASPMPVLSGSTAYYNVYLDTVTAPVTATATTTGSGWMFKAYAVPVGSQASDPCGTFTLDALGKQGVTGTAAVTDCW